MDWEWANILQSRYNFGSIELTRMKSGPILRAGLDTKNVANVKYLVVNLALGSNPLAGTYVVCIGAKK